VAGPLPPRVPGHWLLGNLAERRSDPLTLFSSARRDLGDVVRYRMGYLPVVQLTHPDHVRHVLTADDAYGKGPSWDRLKPLVGEGLVTAEGDLWRQQRRIVQPTFAHDRLLALAGAMTSCTQVLLDRWVASAGTTVDVFDDVRGLTLRIVLRCLFGVEVDEQVPALSRDFTAALEVSDRRIISVMPELPFRYAVPTRDNRVFARSRRSLDAVVATVLERHAARPLDDADLLGALMSGTRDELGSVDLRQLRDEVMTLLFAGFETTANALTWAFVLLDTAPEVTARLQAEVDQVLGGAVPTAEHLPRLAYTRAVIEETLRLRPPVWAIPRVAVRDDEVGGYRVPSGTLVIVVPYVTHRHPDFWTEPDTFDPSRFLPGRRRDISRWAYLPFGGGKRNCLGQHFALMEATLVLAMLASRTELHRSGGAPIEQDPYVTLRPRGPVGMRVTRR
jgi:cytochrome P450